MEEVFRYPSTTDLKYCDQAPFPHTLITDAWDRSVLSKCEEEINQFTNWDGEKEFFGAEKKRYCGDWGKLPPMVRSVIIEASTPRFLNWLEDLTGEKGLISDPYLNGGGIHSITRGGYLKIHADFNWHEKIKLYRRLNLLLYLNSDWISDWGGDLELWDSKVSYCVRKIPPLQNNMVIFTTDEKSFHGHPHPLKSPEVVWRNSLALYYYSSKNPSTIFSFPRTYTDYRPIRGDTFRRYSLIRSFFSPIKIFRKIYRIVFR